MKHSVGALILLALLVQIPIFAEEALLSRAFTIKYRKLEDAAMIANRLLSDRGAVTIQPHIKTIVIQDHESNLKKIEAVLSTFDTPPPSVDFSIQLILARKSDSAPPAEKEMKDIGNVGEVLRFNHYSLLDERTVTSAEGRSAGMNLAGEYQLSFLTDSIHEENGIIRLKNFELRKIKKGKGGKEKAAPLLSMTLNLRNAERLVLGASRYEDSDQALLIILVGRVKK
jgi:hypothetical protein